MATLNLSTIFNNLKFDKIHMQTKLAEEYLNKHEHKFRCLYFEPTTVISKEDNYSNVIECADSSNLSLPSATEKTESWTVISDRLKKLAAEIKGKSDLFCQLEWLIRRVSIKNTQMSIDLIVKNLLHASADWKAAYIEEEVITMTDRAPMLILGFLAQIFKTCDNPIILSTPQTAVLCHLFTEICRDVGWNVVLILTDDFNNLNEIDKNHKVYPNLFNDLLPEITGIITERSDIDSAIDVFLDAGIYPIPLSRILVQESVYEEFKDILTWKCKTSHDKGSDENTEKCTNVFKYADKIFLLDYTGHDFTHRSDQVVFVEAYRTVKELLSFVPKYKQLCLSIWVSSVSEANEIALNVDVPIIWINDYCNFTGCNEVIKPIYKRIDSVNLSIKINSSVVQMRKNQENWLKRTFTERCDDILEVIKRIDLTLADKIEPEMTNWKINNFINVDNGMLILGFNIPDKAVIYNTFGTEAVPSPGFDNIIRALINGSGVIIASNPKNEEEMFLAFENQKIPVAFVDEADAESNEKEIIVPLGDSWSFQTKVIWTNFGTIFAN